MLKHFATAILAFCLVAGAVWFMGLKSMFISPSVPQSIVDTQNASATNSTQENTDQAATEQQHVSSGVGPQGAVNLDIESVDLVQGEGGIQLWNLKAHWANIRKTDGLLVVDAPKLDYFLSGEKGDLQITSVTGEIDNDSQVLRFIDTVVATQGETVITGPLLVYNGTQKTMSFLQHSVLDSPEFSGSADYIVWHMTNRVIEAEGNVVVHLKGKTPVGSETTGSGQQQQTGIPEETRNDTTTSIQ